MPFRSVSVTMKYLLLSISVLWLAIHWSSGHSLSKIELKQQPADIYSVQENKDGATLTISNPKPKKPTLREIIYYHIIEKPYRGSNEDETADNPEFVETERPFTNGHGNQLFNPGNPDESSDGTGELDVRVGSGSTIDNRITFPDEDSKEAITTTILPDSPASTLEVSSSEDAVPKSRRKREVPTKSKLGESERAKKRSSRRRHHRRHSSTVKPISNKSEESKRIKRRTTSRENGNLVTDSVELNSKGDEYPNDDLSDNDSRLSNENSNIDSSYKSNEDYNQPNNNNIDSNESKEDNDQHNNDDEWNLSDNDSRLANDMDPSLDSSNESNDNYNYNNNNDSNESKEDNNQHNSDDELNLSDNDSRLANDMDPSLDSSNESNDNYNYNNNNDSNESKEDNNQHNSDDELNISDNDSKLANDMDPNIDSSNESNDNYNYNNNNDSNESKEDSNQHNSDEELNLSDNDSRLANDMNPSIDSSNESNDDYRPNNNNNDSKESKEDNNQHNNDDEWNLSDNDSRPANENPNIDSSNESNEHPNNNNDNWNESKEASNQSGDDFNQSGNLDFSGNNDESKSVDDNSADVSNGSGDNGVYDGNLIEKRSNEYDSVETEDYYNEGDSNESDDASNGNISIQIEENGNWPDYGGWYDEYGNWDYNGENGGYEPDYRGDDTAGEPYPSSEEPDYSIEEPDYSIEEPIHNGDNGPIDSNVQSNVDDKTAISKKFDQILADLHDIFVKGNATVVLPVKVSQTDGSVNVLEMLHDMFSDIKNNTKRPTTGVIIKSGDPNNPNHINVLEGMFTNIIKNDIIINTNQPAMNPEIDGTKTELQTTESNINKEPATNMDLDSAFTSNPAEYITETTPDQSYITGEFSENPYETTPYAFSINQNKDPTEAFTSPPINEYENHKSNESAESKTGNEDREDNKHNDSHEANPNKTEKPETDVEVTEKNKNDHQKPESNEINQDKDKTDNNNEYHENPNENEDVTKKPHNNDEIKKPDETDIDDDKTQNPVEDHSKEPDDKKENKCTTESNKDSKNPEGDNNTKLDYMLDLVNNEKFWTFMGSLAAKSLESLTERTTKYIKEEIAAQLSKYFEEHKLVVATEAPILDPHKIELPDNKPQTDDKNEKHDFTENDINNNEIKPTTGHNLDKPIENTTEDPASEEIRENKKRVPKEPVHVEATNIYGNTVGNDKVTNVYVFYASKNIDEIMKNIKHLINGNNSTTIIYNFESHEPVHDHNNDDNKENPVDVTDGKVIDESTDGSNSHEPTGVPPFTDNVTEPNENNIVTEDINNENKVTTESIPEIEEPVTNEYDGHVNTEYTPDFDGFDITTSTNDVIISKEHDTTEPNEVTEGGYDSGKTAETRGTTESESQDDIHTTPSINGNNDIDSTDPNQNEGSNGFSVTDEPVTNANNDGNDDNNGIEVTSESETNHDDVTDSTNGIDVESDGTGTDSTNESDDNNATTTKVDETNGNDEEPDKKIESTTESHINDVTDSTFDEITTESNNDEQGENPSTDGVTGSEEISSTTVKVDEIVTNGADEESDNKIDNTTEPESHTDDVTDSTIDIITSESNIDGQGDNPSTDNVNGSDEISSTTFKVDDVVPYKDDEESDNNIESTTQSELHKDGTDFTGDEPVTNGSEEHNINGNDEGTTTEPNEIDIDATTSMIDESTVTEDYTQSPEADTHETDNAVTTHTNDVNDEDHKTNDENSSVTETHNDTDGSENSSSDGGIDVPTTGEAENEMTEPNKNDSGENATENTVNDETTVSADIVTANSTDVLTTENNADTNDDSENIGGADNSENDIIDVTEKTEDGEISTTHDVSEEEKLENNDTATGETESSEIEQVTTAKAENFELDQSVADTKESFSEKSTKNKKGTAENSSEKQGYGESIEKALEMPVEKSGGSHDNTIF